MLTAHSIRPSRQPAPLVTWVSVTDADGRVHLEMRWHVRDLHRSAHRTTAA